MNEPIQMVDLHGQYLEIKQEIDDAIQDVLNATDFIRGKAVSDLERALAEYLGGEHCIGVANGTDALQLAMMAADIGPGDEVITTPFTFIATAEAAALLGATPVFVDIDPVSFNIDPERITGAVTPRTRAIVPVHVFGASVDMDPLLDIARKHDLVVIEDNAQAVGATYKKARTGYIGDIGCVSFFPSKNLGAYGDAGAVLTNDDKLAERVRMISNHGSRRKYYNEVVGVNSRLDTLQAAILNVKLKRLDEYTQRRQAAADRYDHLLSHVEQIVLPARPSFGSHVFHQYSLRVKAGRDQRDALVEHLREAGIPSAVYYPVPLHRLPVFGGSARIAGDLQHSERAADEVLSLPMHTQLTGEQQHFISQRVAEFFTP